MRIITIFAFFIIFSMTFCQPNNKKVLIYSTVTGSSHLQFMSTIGTILQGDGYNVTLLLPVVDIMAKIRNPITDRINQVIVLEADRESLAAREAFGGADSRKKAWTMGEGISGIFKHMGAISACMESACRNVFKRSDLLDYLKSEKFDIGISEPLLACGFGLFDYLGIEKTFSIDSHSGLESTKIAHGLAMTTSFVPPVYSSNSDKMSILGRAQNIIESYFNYLVADYMLSAELNTVKQVHTSVRDWKSLLRQTSYVFINSNPLIDFAVPKTQKFIDIGGIAAEEQRKTETLDEYFDEILNIRPKNVLVSFGSNGLSIDMLPQMKKSLIGVFSSMPDTTFIWKYENTSNDIIRHFAGRPLDNVILTEWQPQRALLADRRLDVFMTHGGLGSTTEVAISGKPAIMVPLFGDQVRNAKMLEKHGTAIVMTKKDLMNSDKILTAFKEILNNPKYQQNARQLAEKLRNQPENPKKKFLDYVNFVSKYGKPHGLDSEAVNLSVYQYYHLDILTVLLVTVAITVIGLKHLIGLTITMKYKID